MPLTRRHRRSQLTAALAWPLTDRVPSPPSESPPPLPPRRPPLPAPFAPLRSRRPPLLPPPPFAPLLPPPPCQLAPRLLRRRRYRTGYGRRAGRTGQTAAGVAAVVGRWRRHWRAEPLPVAGRVVRPGPCSSQGPSAESTPAALQQQRFREPNRVRAEQTGAAPAFPNDRTFVQKGLGDARNPRHRRGGRP
jgi:hypothetical protein